MDRYWIGPTVRLYGSSGGFSLKGVHAPGRSTTVRAEQRLPGRHPGPVREAESSGLRSLDSGLSADLRAARDRANHAAGHGGERVLRFSGCHLSDVERSRAGGVSCVRGRCVRGRGRFRRQTDCDAVSGRRQPYRPDRPAEGGYGYGLAAGGQTGQAETPACRRRQHRENFRDAGSGSMTFSWRRALRGTILCAAMTGATRNPLWAADPPNLPVVFNPVVSYPSLAPLPVFQVQLTQFAVRNDFD